MRTNLYFQIVTLHHDGDHDHQQHLEEDYSHEDVVHMRMRN